MLQPSGMSSDDPDGRAQRRVVPRVRTVAALLVLGVLLAGGCRAWLRVTTADRAAIEREERSILEASLGGIGIESTGTVLTSDLVTCDPPLFGRTKVRVVSRIRPDVRRDQASVFLDRFASFWGTSHTGVLADVRVTDVGMTRGDPSVFARSPDFILNAFDSAVDGLVVTVDSDCVAL